jgi:hypothetical protein
MSFAKNSSLRNFEKTNADLVVFALFRIFNESGRWHESLDAMCKKLLGTEDERDQANRQWHKQGNVIYQARCAAYVAKMGNFAWLTEGCQYGVFLHTLIRRTDIVIHAFHFGAAAVGRSDDPLAYVIHRPGDEDDLDKVYLIERKLVCVGGVMREEWVKEPIRTAFEQHQTQAAADY